MAHDTRFRSRFGQEIGELNIAQRENWQARHLKTLRTCYSRAPHFAETFSHYERIAEPAVGKAGRLERTAST